MEVIPPENPYGTVKRSRRCCLRPPRVCTGRWMRSCRHTQGAGIEQLAAVEGLAPCHMPQRQGQFAHHRRNRLTLEAAIAFDLFLIPGRDDSVLSGPSQGREVQVFSCLARSALGDFQLPDVLAAAAFLEIEAESFEVAVWVGVIQRRPLRGR